MPYETPLNPPREWFSPPADGIPTDKRITVEGNGRVFGYIALWKTCHAGLQGCVRPPKGSPSDYEYAHQGETETDDGQVVRTAVIAGGAGHAPMDMRNAMVPAYYDNSGTQLMRVRYGEDDNGLWFAGALWPDVNEVDVAHIRASSLSGDWRWHAAWRQTAGGYDFAGACLVNIPGYPMPTAEAGRVAESAGRMSTLAASMGAGWIVVDGEHAWDTSVLIAAATPVHTSDKAPMDLPWEAGEVMRRVEREDTLHLIHAWRDTDGDPQLKSSYKLPHHDEHGRVVWRGVVAAMSRLMQARTQIPEADRRDVYNHLAAHYHQFGEEPPPFDGDEPPVTATANEGEEYVILNEEQLSEVVEAVRAAIAPPVVQAAGDCDGSCKECTCGKDEAPEEEKPTVEQLIASISEKVDGFGARLDPIEADILARQVIED